MPANTIAIFDKQFSEIHIGKAPHPFLIVSRVTVDEAHSLVKPYNLGG